MNIAVVVFITSVIALLYVVAGYPLVLAMLRRSRPVGARTPTRWPSVSVILPVRNGEKWLRKKLECLLKLDYPADVLDVIVVSDGSTDNTEAIVREYESGGGVRLLQSTGSGKAAAINDALRVASGELLLFTDVRQRIGSDALKHLVAALQDPDVGVASGELMIDSGDNSEQQTIGLYWTYEKWIRKRHSRIDSVLGATGAIYCMRRSLARELPRNTLLDDVYLPMAAFFQGYRVVFVPEAKAYDEPTELKTEFQRKVRTLAGVYQLIGVYPQLLGWRNRMWFHFFSHKFARLLLPFLLLAVFISSALLPSPIAAFAVGGQVLFYVLAFVDRWIPEGVWCKRMTSAARTFVVLALAALLALSIIVRPAESFWKTPTKAA